MFWRYDLEDSLAYMTQIWLRADSRPVLCTVAGVAVAITFATRLLGL